MKFRILTFSIFFGCHVFCQDLTINPKTGLVSIQDSIDTKNRSLQEVKDLISNWGNTLVDPENLKKIYKLNSSKQTEQVSILLPIGNPVLTQDKGGNMFLTNGTLFYSKIKSNGINQISPIYINGTIKFNFYHIIISRKTLYEFTNIEYSHDGVHYGKFEDEKPPQDLQNRSLIFKMGKKEWKEVRAEYFDNLKILAENLKEYATKYMQSTQIVVNQSPINYESYKKITTGMSYDDVVKLLADEGKELSNTSSQVNGKTVTQQTVIWNDFDKTKSITIIFNDGKVVSKSQTNL